MTYHIKYHTGGGDSSVETDDISVAQEAADAGASYTQQPITIEDDGGEVVCRREWWGVRYSPDEGEADDPILFGAAAGHYGDWQ